MDRDAVEELRALLDEAHSPEDHEDETMRLLSMVKVRKATRPRVSPQKSFSESKPAMTAEEMDRMDELVGMPAGTLKQTWEIARTRRRKS